MKKLLAFLLPAVILAASLTGCGVSGKVIEAGDEGYAEGAIGDTMRTYFFDYTIKDAYLCSEFEGYAPTEGYSLLVAEINVKNTFDESITMFDWDFVVLWPDENGGDLYDYPVTSYEDVVLPSPASDKLLPAEYDLEKKKSRSGLLLFEVPEGMSELSIAYIESFDDDTTGNAFYTDFIPEEK